MGFIVSNEDNVWISTHYPNLIIDIQNNLIEGEIFINRSYQNIALQDSYEIKISLLANNTQSIIPKVYEVSTKIFNTAKKYSKEEIDLHINTNDKSFCLTMYACEKNSFKNGFTFIEFFKNMLEPYLYWQSYYARYGKAPWSEYAHGNLGYLELYAENKISLGGLKNNISVKDLSNMIYHYDYKNDKCLCGKAKNMKNCHPLVFNGMKKLRNELFGKK